MSTQVAATMMVGTVNSDWYGSTYAPTHQLILLEGHRASWRSIPLDPREAQSRLARQRRSGNGSHWIVGLPDGPRHLVAQGLLVYLAEAVPQTLANDPVLTELVVPGPALLQVQTAVPDDETASRVAKAMPGQAIVTLTLFPPCSIQEKEILTLTAAGVRICASSVDVQGVSA